MRRVIVIASLLMAAGCGGSGARESATADSTSIVLPVPDSVQAASPATAAPGGVDSLAAARPSPPTKAPTKAPTKTAPAPHIGYDSAIQPRFVVDSTGKLVPVRTKKPH